MARTRAEAKDGPKKPPPSVWHRSNPKKLSASAWVREKVELFERLSGLKCRDVIIPKSLAADARRTFEEVELSMRAPEPGAQFIGMHDDVRVWLEPDPEKKL